jgi:hypothetical protein
MQQEKREKEQRIKEAEKREREREWREQAENSTCWTTWKEMTRSEKMECINWYLNNIAKIKHQKARNEEIKRWLKADSTQIVRSMKWVMMECGYICHPWE